MAHHHQGRPEVLRRASRGGLRNWSMSGDEPPTTSRIPTGSRQTHRGDPSGPIVGAERSGALGQGPHPVRGAKLDQREPPVRPVRINVIPIS